MQSRCDRIILLVRDGAGWRTAPLRVLERYPVSSTCRSGLQPAETLWVHVDELIVNRPFETLADLDAVVAKRRNAIGNERNLIRVRLASTGPNRELPI